MRRRAFLSSACGAGVAAKPAPRPASPITTVVVSRMDDRHEGFPDMVRLRNGELLVVYRESDAHSAKAFCNVVLRRSADNGLT